MDTISPPGYDVLLLVLAVPAAVATFLLLTLRVWRYYHRQQHLHLRLVLGAFALSAAALGMIARPLTDLFPSLTDMARLEAPAVRFIMLVSAIALLWDELTEPD